tara:strand:+ start:145367 stop:146806 length:1440 start_codon:yes stop_codon:yes gene_type:complete
MSPKPNDSDDLPPTVLASDANSVDALEIDYDEEIAPIGQSLGRYQISEMIARGGMGLVYRAVDKMLCRDVAIKILRRCHRDSPSIRQRFNDEARVTGQLQHPGIVPIYETGQSSDGDAYFAMKLVEGETLADLLATNSGQSRDRSRQLQVFQQMCQTVAYAHSRGVIHLDLKPGNVMVGEFGEVHVMDWGLCQSLRGRSRVRADEDDAMCRTLRGTTGSRSLLLRQDVDPSLGKIDAFDPQAWSDGQVLGTPAYMPPEQARGDAVGPLADVFGLGAVLCEILTGRPPFCGDDLRDVYRKSSRGETQSAIQSLNESAREEPLLRLAKQCLDVNPLNRPKDAGAVAAEIGRFLESALKRAEHDLARFFEISMDMFCIASLDGYFKRVNSNFSRVLGYSDAELVSRPFLDFVHPDDIDSTVAVMQGLNHGNPVVRFRNRYLDSDGRYHWMEWTAKSIPEENIVFAVARDVTDGVSVNSQKGL